MCDRRWLLALCTAAAAAPDAQCSGAAEDAEGVCIGDVFGPHMREVATCTRYDLAGQRYPLGASGYVDIPRRNVSELSPKKFFEKYVKTNTPLLLSGVAPALFNGVDEGAWTYDALMRSSHAKVKFPVKQQHVRLAGPPDARLDVGEIYSQSNRTVLFKAVPINTLRSNKGEITGKGKSAGGKQTMELGLHKEYWNKVKRQTFFQEDMTMTRGTFNMHLSVKGGAIPHSHGSTLNVLLQGTKRWLLVNPTDYPTHDARVDFEQIDRMDAQRHGTGEAAQLGYTSQDWYQNEAFALLEKYKLPYHEFIQHEGDAIFIPNYWTHATMDLCRATFGVELMGHILDRGYVAPEVSDLTEHGFRDS